MSNRNDIKAKAMYLLYQQGKSLSQIAVEFGVTRQCVYDYFKSRNYVLRERPKPKPFIEFNGARYTVRNTGYYAKTTGKRTLLHRDIWESVNGIIPIGYDIHHIDGDRTHNTLINFELIAKDVHASKFGTKRNQNSDKTHCKRGHIFDDANTYWYKGHRICKACAAQREREKRSKR